MRVEPVTDTNIAIIGAGVGGCIAALALAPHYSVTLIDKLATPEPRVGECLPPAALRILRRLDLAGLMTSVHMLSQGMVSFWGCEQPDIVDNLKNPDGFGWHLDRQHFEQQLRNAVIQRGIATRWPAHLHGIARQSDGAGKRWKLDIEHQNQPEMIRADIVIDATGRHCWLARQLDVKRVQLDKLMSVWFTAQVAVRKKLGVIADAKPGWWYSAPIPRLPGKPVDNHSGWQPRVFSWQADARDIPKDIVKSPDALLAKAARVKGFNTLIAQTDRPSVKVHGMVAANSSRLSQVCGDDWFAIGDAAMSFDPLSSQGMFNAMATAMQLSDLLIDNGHKNPGNRGDFQQQMDAIWRKYLEHKSMFYKMVV